MLAVPFDLELAIYVYLGCSRGRWKKTPFIPQSQDGFKISLRLCEECTQLLIGIHRMWPRMLSSGLKVKVQTAD